MADAATSGEVVAELLAAAGVRRVIGEPLGSLRHVAVSDDDAAVLLADADGRVNGGWGAALIDEQILHLSSQPGGTAHPTTVTTVVEVADLLRGAGSLVPATMAMYLDLDLDTPCDDFPATHSEPPGVVATLAPELADLDVAVLVGPGVVRAGAEAIAGLDSFARHSGCAVTNTFGAKGVFRWDSPFHAGTVGLQERDIELAGIVDADLVIVSGLDAAEVDAAAFGDTLVMEVDPRQFAAVAFRWPAASGPPEERSDLYRRIAEIVTPLYEDGSAPTNGARASLHLAGAAPASGVVVADAGPAGFWVARTFPTGIAGSVAVCAVPIEGAAIAGALAASWDGRPAMAVTHSVGPMGEEILAVARQQDAAFGVQVWTEDGHVLDADAHAALCVSQFGASNISVEQIAVTTAVPDTLVDVAGAVSPAFRERDLS